METETKRALTTTSLVLLAWLVASIAFSLLGLFDQPNVPPIYFGIFLAIPTIGFLVAYGASARYRKVLFALPLWVVTAVHSLRFVGIAFVAGALTGTLPAAFGWPAGLGDTAAAIVSIPLVVAQRRNRRSRALRIRYVAWNIFGLTDLVTAVTLGLLYSVSDLGVLGSPESNTRDLSFFPMSLIPTIYVPVLVLLHILGLRRNRELA